MNRLATAIKASLAKPAVQHKLRGLGALLVALPPAEYRDGLKPYHDRWRKLIRDAGVKAE